MFYLVILANVRNAGLPVAAAAALASTACGTPAASPGFGRQIVRVSRGSVGPITPRSSLPSLTGSERAAAATPPGQAHRVAARFFTTYARFLYGRIAATKVLGTSPQLRSVLGREPNRVTPAEQSANPRILHTTVTPAGPPASALATATLLAAGRPYRLTATLEQQGRRWIVVAIGS